MAIVYLRSGTFNNGDNLHTWFPQGAGTVTRVGEMNALGARHITRAVVALASLPTVASTNKQVLSETCVFPAGAFIEQVDVFVTKETAGTNANFNLGFIKATDHSTEVDFDGLLAAADVFNGGTDLGTLTTYVVGTTEVGALVGTQLAFNSILVGYPDTGDFTAGVLDIRIYWSIPLTADV